MENVSRATHVESARYRYHVTLNTSAILQQTLYRRTADFLIARDAYVASRRARRHSARNFSNGDDDKSWTRARTHPSGKLITLPVAIDSSRWN